MNRNQVTKADMQLISEILPYRNGEPIPFRCCIDGKPIIGFPEGATVTETAGLADSNIIRKTVTAVTPEQLVITGEYTEYRDFPVTEWLFTVTNRGTEASALISDIRVGGVIRGHTPVLTHGNGDTCDRTGYSFTQERVDKSLRFTPFSGTSCQGAFPYYTLDFEEMTLRAAVGWPTKWVTEISPANEGVLFLCGQDRCSFRLAPGETWRTPRLTLMAYAPSDAYRGMNLWRHWYFAHILPRQYGLPIQPKLCMHYFAAEGMPEFTGASEENQLNALQTYRSRGINPDVWWVDAGWYPCNGDWPNIGTWKPSPRRFPNGLGKLGEACVEGGTDFLLWFEPERVRPDSELDTQHPEWILKDPATDDGKYANRLFNLADPAALRYLCETVNGLIQKSHVRFYRQDFNFDPLPIWKANEDADRVGLLENQHGQGYLAYWDYLLLHNPGLVIDSCASGGRRNDLETMRRSVCLHYTDVGYGEHPIKQKQHREMFEWIPYFRAHNMSWDNIQTGKYDGTYQSNPPSTDAYAYMNAFTPAITDMLVYNDTDEQYNLAKKMQPIWRACAAMTLQGDYYPITECTGEPDGWYAHQFDCPDKGTGFVLYMRNTCCEEECFVLRLPCLEVGKRYCFTDSETGEKFRRSAEELKQGETVRLPKRTGKVLFYKVCEVEKNDH